MLISDKKYQLIYADPPWNFETWSQKGEKKSASNHYSIMTMDDIGNLPISSISDDNCILFMWATDPLLPKQIQIMEKWGFTYKTVGFVWIKTNRKTMSSFIGLGYYTRSNPEYCLVGVKGYVGRPERKDISEVVMNPIREHSQKPDIIYEHLEAMYPDFSKIELFCRGGRSGWTSWGNEVGKYSTLDSFYS